MPTDRVGRILVVDDDRDTVEMVAQYFTARGFDVATARSGGDALLLAHYARPDVVLLDIKMPGMSGDQVLQELRLRWPDLPVVMLSGIVDVDLAQRTLRRGAFDYVCKPLEWDHLSECVAAALATTPDPTDHRASRAISPTSATGSNGFSQNA